VPGLEEDVEDLHSWKQTASHTSRDPAPQGSEVLAAGGQAGGGEGAASSGVAGSGPDAAAAPFAMAGTAATMLEGAAEEAQGGSRGQTS
jgi:hypothetical protein